MENNERVKIISDEYLPISPITEEEMKNENGEKKPKTNKKKKVTANKYNIVNQFSLRGIKDKNKQRTLLQNRISELEKELKERKEQLDKVNEELFEEDIKKITEKYSKEKIIKALEQ